MSTEAFGSRRVTRSLQEIAQYLDEGIKVAGGVKPGQGVRLDLEPVVITLNPRIKSVSWKETGSGVLRLPLGSNVADLVVLGEDLDLTDTFRIVGAAGSADVAAKAILENSHSRFVARMTFNGDPTPGSYRAYATNRAKQTSMLEKACEIQPAPVPVPVPAPQSQSSLQLGSLIPNLAFHGKPLYAILVVLQGRPTKFRITDAAGATGGWSVKEVTQDDYVLGSASSGQHYRAYEAGLRILHRDAELRFLEIRAIQTTQPKGQQSAQNRAPTTTAQVLRLVAESDQSQDSLALFIQPQPEPMGS